MAARSVVWIIDDSALQGEIARRALDPLYAVAVYQSAAAMLEQLMTARAPDLLVLDWHMPDISGAEVCGHVRTTRNLVELPILILTSEESSESFAEAFAYGANDFLRKPFSELELRARVAVLVQIAVLHAKLTLVEREQRIEADFRERFMGMLAHDLRQPLSTVLLACQVLASGTYESIGRYTDMQKRAAQRMQRMIGDLLDFTSIRPESGMPIHQQATNLQNIVQTSVAEFGAVHPERAFSLAIDGQATGHWDPDRLMQVCTNLLGNALEHSTPSSPIDVSLVSDATHVELSVSNRGPTIPDDILPTLFKPFRRKAARRASGGVGLGLHIVHQIVHAHGGTVSVTSANSATRFAVRLPRDVAKSEGDTAPASDRVSSPASQGSR